MLNTSSKRNKHITPKLSTPPKLKWDIIPMVQRRIEGTSVSGERELLRYGRKGVVGSTTTLAKDYES